MLEGQQRDVGEVVIGDGFSLRPKPLDDLGHFDGVPIEDGIGDEAQAGGLVHDFDVVSGRKLALVCKEDPARELLSVLSLVELTLDVLAQLAVGAVAQDVVGLDESPEVSHGL